MSSASDAHSPRIAMLDRDSGFLQVLANRLDAAGWSHRVLASPVPPDQLVAMRLNVVVIDLAVLGPQACAIAYFRDRHPKVALELEEADPHECAERLRGESSTWPSSTSSPTTSRSRRSCASHRCSRIASTSRSLPAIALSPAAGSA